MQRIYLAGEKKKAVCQTCEGLVKATFQYGTYVHQDGTNVPHVLMLYCDDCNSQLAHAHQSSYLIQKSRRSTWHWQS
jgi:RNase P subunit RPR2